jgi:hypothetical protein
MFQIHKDNTSDKRAWQVLSVLVVRKKTFEAPKSDLRSLFGVVTNPITLGSDCEKYSVIFPASSPEPYAIDTTVLRLG